LAPAPGIDGRERWEGFAAAVASVAQVRAEDIARSTRLVEDLGLDSLALTEVVVLLIVELDMDTVSDDLERRDWADVTVGDLYNEYCRNWPTT
jgi:acyl carrier protein